MNNYLNTKGRIFDVQKFSVHDGPGVRTIIFLKGCFIRCRWCCNPESQRHEIEKMVMNGKEKIVGRDVTVAEVMEIIEQDRIYYRRSGGGVTLSGGECLAQPDFAARRKQFDTLIAAPQDMTQIHAYFDALFKEVIEAGNIRQKERRGSLISQITERIGEELNNPYLNSQSLADEFSFSSAYLCRIFKQETGVSLADYINVQRIEYAKTLLHNPDMLVKDIALETGFSSEKYFYVVFRKITGITPAMFILRGKLLD